MRSRKARLAEGRADSRSRGDGGRGGCPCPPPPHQWASDAPHPAEEKGAVRSSGRVRRPRALPVGEGGLPLPCLPYGRLLLGRAGMAGFPRCVVAGEGDRGPQPAEVWLSASVPRGRVHRRSRRGPGSPLGGGARRKLALLPCLRGEARTRSPEWEEGRAKALGAAGSVPERHPWPPLLVSIQGRRECYRHLDEP